MPTQSNNMNPSETTITSNMSTQSNNINLLGITSNMSTQSNKMNPIITGNLCIDMNTISKGNGVTETTKVCLNNDYFSNFSQEKKEAFFKLLKNDS